MAASSLRREYTTATMVAPHVAKRVPCLVGQRDKDEIILNNEVEARLLSSLLEEEEIPHFLRSYHDSAYDGIFQAQLGWGRIEADERHRERIRELLSDLRADQSR
jgi:hypothetical protein